MCCGAIESQNTRSPSAALRVGSSTPVSRTGKGAREPFLRSGCGAVWMECWVAKTHHLHGAKLCIAFFFHNFLRTTDKNPSFASVHATSCASATCKTRKKCRFYH